LRKGHARISTVFGLPRSLWPPRPPFAPRIFVACALEGKFLYIFFGYMPLWRGLCRTPDGPFLHSQGIAPDTSSPRCRLPMPRLIPGSMPCCDNPSLSILYSYLLPSQHSHTGNLIFKQLNTTSTIATFLTKKRPSALTLSKLTRCRPRWLDIPLTAFLHTKPFQPRTSRLEGGMLTSSYFELIERNTLAPGL